MATLESIQARIAKLQAQAEVVASTKSTAALERIRDLMHKYSVSVADIEGFVGKRRGRKPGQAGSAKAGASAPKYLDPKTGATWTGHQSAQHIPRRQEDNRLLFDVIELLRVHACFPFGDPFAYVRPKIEPD
ncbi:H-NS histone family protein [Paraburkholderia bannensis]|uniref:H-NS histone family protein n=1 Tax=Paraburkholderia bannensis TaxID=765414 RepID=UPI002AB7DB7F|nr:H-NS histone family protein [Paraburkholderia bannensis]